MRVVLPADVHLTRRFAAPPARVFDAWLDAGTVKQWMFVRPAEEMLRVAIDPRVGGAFSFALRKNGEEIEHSGKYLEIDRPRRLVFTWAEGEDEGIDRVIVAIAPHGTGCELKLTHELHPDWADYTARAEAAWTKMFDALEKLLS